MINVLFAAPPQHWDDYAKPLQRGFAQAGLDVDLRRDHPPETVDYIVFAPGGPVQDFTPFTRCQAVLSLWAGVETIVGNATLTQPLVRMVDDGLTRGMVEWVTGHTLRHHLGMDTHIHGQDGQWRDGVYPPLARNRPVTILGLGALGLACAQALSDLGFPVTGWARSPRDTGDIRCLHGAQGLPRSLTDAQIVILLLPDTPATTHVLNAETLPLLAPGAFILNPGRGPLIDDTALIKALDSGHIAHATLDVFATEPLPADHPYWRHPAVTVTPHIASTTRPETAAWTLSRVIKNHQSGLPLPHTVNRKAGY